jgi:tetratricopeptide (TPR) repeat protein
VTAQARVEELRAYMHQEGITADRSIARGFAYEGYENLREGNYERAREAFDLARTFDPQLSQAQFGYAWSLLKSGRGVFPFIDEYLHGITLAWVHFSADEIIVSNFVIVTTLGIFCSLTAISLLVVLRCQGRFRHDLFELLRRPLGKRTAQLVAWVVFLLPLLVWAGGIWLLLFWLMLGFRYMRVPEKVVAAMVFLMVGLSPLGVRLVLDRFQASSDPETRIVVQAMQEGYNPETIRQLRQVVTRHPEDPELHLLLGTLYAKGDLQNEAYATFQRVLELQPTNVRAIVDIGNVYFRLGEYAEAVTRYKEAQQLQPKTLAALWNLYLSQTELLHFSEAESSLAAARDLDGERIGALLAQKKDGGSGLPVQELAALDQIKLELRGDRISAISLAMSLANPFSIASGAGLLFALILGVGRKGENSESCRRCGRAFCGRCESSGVGYCPRCMHLTLKREQITADNRVDEMTRLRRRNRFRSVGRRIASLVLPGSGLILADRAARGIPVMVGWILLGLHLLARDRLLLPERVPVLDMPEPLLVLGLTVMVVLWIAGNFARTAPGQPLGDAHGA